MFVNKHWRHLANFKLLLLLNPDYYFGANVSGDETKCLITLSYIPLLQPTDDIVLMAQSLEKAFLQKVAQMPQEEVELAPPPPRSKPAKIGKKGRANAGERCQAQTCTVYNHHAYMAVSIHTQINNFLNEYLYLLSTHLSSLWWSDDSSSGPSSFPVSVLASHPRNA